MSADIIEYRLFAAALDQRTLKPGEVELLLAEANVHLRKNALPQWAASTRHFFEAHDLAITVDASSDHRHLFERLGSVAPPGEADSSGPLVVVVMTTFNAEQSVEYAVRSVLAQTYRNFRLVVVDDRSTDRTWEILSRLSSEDGRVILRRSDANRGTYCAKNSALAEFEAPFYTFHDSDDWMMPQRLAEHVAFMERNQQVVCSLSQWYRALPDGFALIRRHGGYLHDNPASTFLRQSAIHRVGFFDSVRSGADSEYVARLRRAFGWHSVKTIGKPLSIGLQRSDSLTASGATALAIRSSTACRLVM